MLFTGHLTIFAINFFYNDSDHEIAIPLRKHIQVSDGKKFNLWVIVFWELHSWKIGFVASPETSQKQVFWVKTS
jgi:hypothetical protein